VKNYILSVVGVIVLISSPAFAVKEGGGGTGLSFRLKQSSQLALEVFQTVSPEQLLKGRPDIMAFYQQYKSDLIQDATKTNFRVRPSGEVYKLLQGQGAHRPFYTKFEKGADVLVADDVSVTNLKELTAVILHELGHHLGKDTTQEDFLDDFAWAVVLRASELNPDLQKKFTQGQISSNPSCPNNGKCGIFSWEKALSAFIYAHTPSATELAGKWQVVGYTENARGSENGFYDPQGLRANRQYMSKQTPSDVQVITIGNIRQDFLSTNLAFDSKFEIRVDSPRPTEGINFANDNSLYLDNVQLSGFVDGNAACMSLSGERPIRCKAIDASRLICFEIESPYFNLLAYFGLSRTN